MKLLKIEEHNYSIVYVNDNENYKVYRRFNENKWEVFYRNKWDELRNHDELEQLFKERNTLTKIEN
jgi:hypothetical protein